MHKHQVFNEVNRKQLNILATFSYIWIFISFLSEDDSVLKVAEQITFEELVPYKLIAYKKQCILFIDFGKIRENACQLIIAFIRFTILL